MTQETPRARLRKRLAALIRKETHQMARDKSTLILGLILPVLLLLLFGYGLSLDVLNVPVAVVQDQAPEESRDFLVTLGLSTYFTPRLVTSMREAEPLLRSGDVDAIVRLRRNHAGQTPDLQIVVNGRDTNKARIMQRYLESAAAEWGRKRAAGASREILPQAVAETRLWYNNAQESSYFLVPGVTALIMTLIGALLTALVMAREWERGTFEALFVSPVRALEILLGKIVPYFCLGMGGLLLCLAMAYFVFQVPMRGSILYILLASALYLLVALGIGLLISSFTKSQFLACQIVIVSSFIPTVILSGFLFDLRSMPKALYYIAQILPATWYVELLQTLFLVGNVHELILRDCAILALYAAVLLGLARLATKKSLE